MDRLLRITLADLIRAGIFGSRPRAEKLFTFGDGTGKPVAMRFTSTQRRTRHPARPRVASSAKPTWTAHSWSSRARSPTCLPFVLRPAPRRQPPHWARPQWLLRYAHRRLKQFNPRQRAQRNVAHHYDLDGRLYSLFLDADRQYSCAYFETPDQSLDDAQLAKKRHLAAKLLLDARASACSTSAAAGAGLRSISPRSRERERHRHHAVAGAARASPPRAQPSKALSDKVEFRLQDYRDVPEQFDRIVSVGMFEHVGVGYYDTFFRKCALAARRRRRDAAALDRPLGRPGHHQSVDREIHLPRRLHPGAVGGAAGGRTRRAAGHRHRNPAPALCRDAQGLARALPRASRARSSDSTTRASCGCGSSISRPPKWRSASRP